MNVIAFIPDYSATDKIINHLLDSGSARTGAPFVGI
jgi:hypothetical protein